jgi:hypothetical protein
VAEEELGLLFVGENQSFGDPGQGFKVISRGAPGATRINIDAGSPDSLRNA